MELGAGFAFVGRQVHLEFSSADYFLDLLFYHLKLHCYVVVEITPEEERAGFPPRPIPKPEQASAWKKHTLTNLYNEKPAGLTLRQEQLDKAVATAYGWTDYTPELSDGEILLRLLALNQERSKTEKPLGKT